MIAPRRHYSVPLPGRPPLSLGERTLVMGVLNVTPDSFSDGGLYFDPAAAVDAARRMVHDGVDIIDVGGESSRPGAAEISEEEELARVLPVVERLARSVNVPVSIDTCRAVVAREAVARGAAIVNDISSLQRDPQLAAEVARSGAALILMHNRGRSREMYRQAVYGSVIGEITRELEDAMSRAAAAGVMRSAIILDPGLGFAKRPEHTYEALARLDALAALDRPLLSGPSRKSFLSQAVGERAPVERDWATAAAVTASVLLGAHIVRVHSVRHMVDVVRTAERIRAACG